MNGNQQKERRLPGDANRQGEDKPASYRLFTLIALSILCLVIVACDTPKITVNVNNPVPQAQAAADNWSTYLNNNARSGYDGLGTITRATVAKLKVHWTYREGS